MIKIIIPGRPVPAVRMTQRSKFKDPAAQRYIRYLNDICMCSMPVNPKPLPWTNIAVDVGIYVHGGRRGDCDNYLKALVDGVQKAGIIKNDKIVTDMRVRVFSCNEHEQRAEIELMEVS